ncbi:uncharacterized protein LOC119397802 [Rhipicephalus sanguineus]|uniref:uncharacterized protein LOC119397802 n=1 Tax=Rhipicephalus sanguineus TaxID=34632 RepID=UPI001895E12A|nr:uncharacterized protein LOC119397802 [Rhipicephalus sanguineus]
MQDFVRTLVIIGLVGNLVVPSYPMVHASVPAIRGTMALAFLTSCFVGGSTFLCEKQGGACKYNTDCCHRLVCLQITKTCEPRGAHARHGRLGRTKSVTRPGGRALPMRTTAG